MKINATFGKPYKPLLTMPPEVRIVLLYGGRLAGRSFSASLYALVTLCVEEYARIALMRFIKSDIRDSIWRDFTDRLDEQGLPEPRNNNEMRYSLNGNELACKGFKTSTSQNEAKLKSIAGYTHVIIEEADEVTEDDFHKLNKSVRTKKGDNKIILLFNMPHKDHWLIKEFFNLVDDGVAPEGFYKPVPKDRDDVLYINTSYHDNVANLQPSAIAEIERDKKRDPQKYWNVIEGYVSEGRRGRIYEDVQFCSSEDYDDIDKQEFYGLDFGWNDPNALIGIKYVNDKIYMREYIYSGDMTSDTLAKRIEELGIDEQIICEREPKTIQELRERNIWCTEAEKGHIFEGVKSLQKYTFVVDENSSNLIMELQNYTWSVDKDKNLKNTPVDAYNHLLDALRYVHNTPQISVTV